MTSLVLVLVTATAAGLLSRLVRVPPLAGYLLAGFCLGFAGVEGFPGLEEIADVGVTLLLFAIGLKFNVRTLVRPQTWGTATAHMVVLSVVGAGFVALLAGIGLVTARDGLTSFALVAFALSFSSTVLVVKILEGRSDDGAYYGQTAIGILVVQDLAAVVFISASNGESPSPWALALVGLVPAAWLIRKLLAHVDAAELLVLLGVALALGPGYWLFDLVGLKGDLGALVLGLLLAGAEGSGRMGKALLGLKELFLVAFFLSIGIEVLPSGADVLAALVLVVVLVPVNVAVFVALGRAFGLRNRTAVLSGLALGNFSEFSIIVVDVGVGAGLLADRWLVVVAVSVAMSMVVSAIVNGRGLRLTRWLSERMRDQDPARITPEDRPVDTGDAEVLVLGMGRMGHAAYDRFRDTYGMEVMGIDNDMAVTRRLAKDGYRVLEGDATELEFWHRITTAHTVHTVVLAMTQHDSNVYALERLRDSRYTGRLAAVVRTADQERHFRQAGVHAVFNLYEGAGITLADAAAGEDGDPSYDGRR
ncbi:cation:proton antiporter family protein [Brevibacterium litoralis]|uniref:cation:proton antiporter family protein n=1 Tax=Brevibacterium litoralis TaxID=3138935 RepID=UPI0032EBF01A